MAKWELANTIYHRCGAAALRSAALRPHDRAQRTNPCTFIYTNPCAILCTNPCCKINRTNPLYFFLHKCTCSTHMTSMRDTQVHAAANKIRSRRRSKSLRRGRKVVETLFLSGWVAMPSGPGTIEAAAVKHTYAVRRAFQTPEKTHIKHTLTH